MPIFIPEIVSERGKVDAKRHRQKKHKDVKDMLPKIIANESIITSKRGKIIKIPIKEIQIPYFRPGKGKKGVGTGQGDGEPGDIIDRKPGKGKIGKPGSQPGEDYIETEIEIEELIEMMFEDLGLPRLEEKETRQLIINLGHKIHGHTKSGSPVLRDARRTTQEGMKRFWNILKALEEETKKDELVCFNALREADGLMGDALDLLQDPNFKGKLTKIEPFPILEAKDEIFHKLEENTIKQSNAVIIAMMDVSGSMTTAKKYFARSMLFWLVEFLKKLYKNVEIRFIIHEATAIMVDEESFFKTGTSGGTQCYTAYELAGSLIDSEYPTNQWNVYVWHFSDGEDFAPDKTVKEMDKIFARNINMLGYGEVKPEEEVGFAASKPGSELMAAIKEFFRIQEIFDEDLSVIAGKDVPLLGVVITKKKHLLMALKQFLRKDR